ncbi:MAG TPA: hypothetical protein DDW52_09510 [Planctomycetaceae bacterium]|nr:hypothetical protein [Planctomycetaceae bacterium]
MVPRIGRYYQSKKSHAQNEHSTQLLHRELPRNTSRILNKAVLDVLPEKNGEFAKLSIVLHRSFAIWLYETLPASFTERSDANRFVVRDLESGGLNALN